MDEDALRPEIAITVKSFSIYGLHASPDLAPGA